MAKILKRIEGLMLIIAGVMAFLLGIVGMLAMSGFFTSRDSPVALRLSFEGGSLVRPASPGERVEFQFEQTTVDGHWASPTGLSLTLQNSEGKFRVTFPLVPARKKEWSETITYSQRSNHKVSIPVSFDVPTSQQLIGQTLSGSIAGIVEFPEGQRDGFVNRTVDLQTPVEITVVSPDESARFRAQVRQPLWDALYVAVPGFAVSFGYLIVFGGRWNREHHAARERLLQLVCGCLVLAFASYLVWRGMQGHPLLP